MKKSLFAIAGFAVFFFGSGFASGFTLQGNSPILVAPGENLSIVDGGGETVIMSQQPSYSSGSPAIVSQSGGTPVWDTPYTPDPSSQYAEFHHGTAYHGASHYGGSQYAEMEATVNEISLLDRATKSETSVAKLIIKNIAYDAWIEVEGEFYHHKDTTGLAGVLVKIPVAPKDAQISPTSIVVRTARSPRDIRNGNAKAQEVTVLAEQIVEFDWTREFADLQLDEEVATRIPYVKPARVAYVAYDPTMGFANQDSIAPDEWAPGPISVLDNTTLDNTTCLPAGSLSHGSLSLGSTSCGAMSFPFAIGTDTLCEQPKLKLNGNNPIVVAFADPNQMFTKLLILKGQQQLVIMLKSKCFLEGQAWLTYTDLNNHLAVAKPCDFKLELKLGKIKLAASGQGEAVVDLTTTAANLQEMIKSNTELNRMLIEAAPQTTPATEPNASIKLTKLSVVFENEIPTHSTVTTQPETKLNVPADIKLNLILNK